MKFSAFWETGSRACVVVAEESTPSGAGFALCERAADGASRVLATSDGWAESLRSPAKAMMCCARISPDVAECELIDMENADTILGRFRLVDLAPTDSPWRIALRYGDGVDEAPLLFSRLGSRASTAEMIARFRRSRPSATPATAVGWMIAARMSGDDIDAPALAPCALIWPPEPSITVAPLLDQREELPQRPTAPSTALMRMAFAPMRGMPRLALTTDEPTQIEKAGRLHLVSIAHQVRFFEDKSRFLGNQGKPIIQPRELDEFEETPTSEETQFAAGEESKVTRVFAFDWRAGRPGEGVFDPGNPRPVIVEINEAATRAMIRFDDAALGDDLYLIAPEPIMRAAAGEPLVATLGFRASFNGFARLDLDAEDNLAWKLQAEDAAARDQGQGFVFGQRADAGAGGGNPLRGPFEAAHAAARRGGGAVDFEEFRAAPALHAEIGRWRGGAAARPAQVATARGLRLADALAAAAGVRTGLTPRSDAAEQIAVTRGLRDGVNIDRLRGLRILLPTDADTIARAFAAAGVLANLERVHEVARIARDRKKTEFANLLSAFLARAADEWTPVDLAERLANFVRDISARRGVSARGPVAHARLPPRELSDMCVDFERQLNAARATSADGASLDELEREYQNLRDTDELDSVDTLPDLEKRLDALTAGPIIELNFSRAVDALETWAGLEGFSRKMSPRLGLAAAPRASAAARIAALVLHMRSPAIDQSPPGWRESRDEVRKTVSARWLEVNGALRSPDVQTHGALVTRYADAMFQHKAYVHLLGLRERSNRGLGREQEAAFADMSRAWPLEAGAAWKAAAQMPDAGLEALTRVPFLCPDPN